jgi:hypothetical protein
MPLVSFVIRRFAFLTPFGVPPPVLIPFFLFIFLEF